MKLHGKTFLSRLFQDERGQILPMMAILLIGFMGTAALSIDLGRAFVSYRELQDSTNAAALAGAQSLPNATAATAAATYSSASGDLNAHPNLPDVTMVAGYPKLECLTSLSKQGMACVAPANANAIQVQQQITLNLFFAQIFGRKTITLTATATASMRGAIPSPYNVAIIMDTTLSMVNYDSNCGNTQMQCALNGVQVLLKSLAPCASDHATCTITNGVAADSVDRVALFTFPNMSVGTAALDLNCTTSIPSSVGGIALYPLSMIYNAPGYFTVLPADPTPWSGVPTAVPYSFPTAGASSYTPASSPSTTPTYQLTGFLSDYRTSDTTTSLNSSSLLVKASGAVASCGGMIPPNYEIDYMTYFAGVLYAAQSALTAEQVANPASKNVIILLGDGDANAPQNSLANQYFGSSIVVMPSPATNSGTYPSYVNECGQAVTAAKYATSKGTTVYTVAYGANSTGCSTDTSPSTNPCATLAGMASGLQDFYSDYTQTGSDGTCVSTYQPTSNLNQIFANIAGNLTKARLIPNTTT